ncbi:MAG: hypothetical protein LW817_02280 [Candidatus Caenarcaniphilales bacterium]|jgi:hypothetical protein|nr:hypothetical protein [Candidatus Caenarcaniphilales bacterium]
MPISFDSTKLTFEKVNKPSQGKDSESTNKQTSNEQTKTTGSTNHLIQFGRPATPNKLISCTQAPNQQEAGTAEDSISFQQARTQMPQVDAKDANSQKFFQSDLHKQLNKPEFLQGLKFNAQTNEPIIGKKEVEHFKKVLEENQRDKPKFSGALNFSSSPEAKGGSFLGQTFMQIDPNHPAAKKASVDPNDPATIDQLKAEGKDPETHAKTMNELYQVHEMNRNGFNVYFVNDKNNPGFHVRNKYNLTTNQNPDGSLGSFSYGSGHGVIVGYRAGIIGKSDKHEVINFGNTNGVEMIPKANVKAFNFNN